MRADPHSGQADEQKILENRTDVTSDRTYDVGDLHKSHRKESIDEDYWGRTVSLGSGPRRPRSGSSKRDVYGHTMQGGPMGPSQMIGQKVFRGYYDSHVDLYLNMDSSSKADAVALHINYSSSLGAVRGEAAMYLVEGKAATRQVAVFGSQPGEVTYSPLWLETHVSWKSGASPVLLTSDNQILALAKKGKLTVKKTNVVLQLPNRQSGRKRLEALIYRMR